MKCILVFVVAALVTVSACKSYSVCNHLHYNIYRQIRNYCQIFENYKQ